MSDNSTDTTNRKKWSKFDILMGVCFILIFGFSGTVNFLGISEGVIEILSNVILAFSFNFITFIGLPAKPPLC